MSTPSRSHPDTQPSPKKSHARPTLADALEFVAESEEMDLQPLMRRFPTLSADQIRDGFRRVAAWLRRAETSHRARAAAALATVPTPPAVKPGAPAVSHPAPARPAPAAAQAKSPSKKAKTSARTAEPPAPTAAAAPAETPETPASPATNAPAAVDLHLKAPKAVKELERLVIHIDGASRGNPGPASLGVVFSDPEGQTLTEGHAFLGQLTNNVAEYHGLLAGLAQALKWGVSRIEIVTDSELLARQMNGSYKVKSPQILPLYNKAKELRSRFAFCQIRHVPRSLNIRADELANEALDRPNSR